MSLPDKVCNKGVAGRRANCLFIPDVTLQTIWGEYHSISPFSIFNLQTFLWASAPEFQTQRNMMVTKMTLNCTQIGRPLSWPAMDALFPSTDRDKCMVNYHPSEPHVTSRYSRKTPFPDQISREEKFSWIRKMFNSSMSYECMDLNEGQSIKFNMIISGTNRREFCC